MIHLTQQLSGSALRQIAERVIKKFDREPELKARIAQALLEVDDEHAA